MAKSGIDVLAAPSHDTQSVREVHAKRVKIARSQEGRHAEFGHFLAETALALPLLKISQKRVDSVDELPRVRRLFAETINNLESL